MMKLDMWTWMKLEIELGTAMQDIQISKDE